ncbi:rubredoxin-like domain-containing protein [Natronospora cellulosivora (SeqCode)]
MKPWRCQICGETYLGKEAPDRCPYCGAAGKNKVSPAEYIDFGVVEMSEKSRKDLEYALELEMNNTAFYKKCAANAENQINMAIFKRLAKHEGEHAELIADMLDIEEGDLPEVEIPENDKERFELAHEHEQKAINFYLEVARTAPETRVRDVFAALSDVELEHLNMSNIYK